MRAAVGVGLIVAGLILTLAIGLFGLWARAQMSVGLTGRAVVILLAAAVVGSGLILVGGWLRARRRDD